MQTAEVSELNMCLFKRVLKLMGNRFEITVAARDESWAHKQITTAIDEIRRIEKLFTSWAPPVVGEIPRVEKSWAISPDEMLTS